MAGSWEIQQHNQVLVVILTREITTTAWAFGLRNLIIPGTLTGLSGMPFDMARNVGCQKVLDLGFQYVFFLDDDTIPPPDAILKLMAHKKPIVSGLYYRRNIPIQPVMLRELPDGNKQWVTEIDPGVSVDQPLMEVDYVGAGCLLINRDVLLSLPPMSNRCHWFDWTIDRTDLPENERMSEDFNFCRNARKNGFPIFVDTSVHCRHVGLGESKIGGTYTPLELLP